MAVGKMLAKLVTSRCDRYQEEDSKNSYEETEHSDVEVLVHGELTCGEGLLVTKARFDARRIRMPNVRVTLVRLSQHVRQAPNACSLTAPKASDNQKDMKKTLTALLHVIRAWGVHSRAEGPE
jgi:hypothetical protein